MELRRNGTPVKIREQSFSILVFLLEHAGELVTREDLRRVLWPSDTFVDFDHSLNTAVMKLREALGDSAEKPLYIETIPKRGYRFIAPVEAVGNSQVMSEGAVSDTRASETPAFGKKRLAGTLVVLAACVLVLAGGGWFVHKGWRSSAPASPVQRSLTRLTFDDGLQTGATWSPDGRLIAYSLQMANSGTTNHDGLRMGESSISSHTMRAFTTCGVSGSIQREGRHWASPFA